MQNSEWVTSEDLPTYRSNVAKETCITRLSSTERERREKEKQRRRERGGQRERVGWRGRGRE